MTLREAAQQALEALEIAPLDHNSIKSRFFEHRHHAIIALRAALAEDSMQRLTDEQQMIERGTKAWAGVPDATAWVEEMRGNKPTLTSNGMPAVEGPLSKSHRTCQESRQVEPVAYVTGFTKGRCTIAAVDPAWLPPVGMALYRSPPKREPLTDEEISKIFIYCGRDKETFARAIERAHGIKEEK